MSANAHKVSYTLSPRSVNGKTYIKLPPVRDIPEMHEQIALALVISAYRCALRRSGEFDVKALQFAYIGSDNLQDNMHVAYMAYVDALTAPTYIDTLVKLSPRVAAYRALSRHIYANKARSAKFNPDFAVDSVKQGQSFEFVARDRMDYFRLVSELMGARSVLAYVVKHPEHKQALHDMTTGSTDSELRNAHHIGGSTVKKLRDILRKACVDIGIK